MNRSNLLTFLFPSHQRTHSNSPWAAHNRSLDLVPYMAPNGGFERHAFPAGKGLRCIYYGHVSREFQSSNEVQWYQENTKIIVSSDGRKRFFWKTSENAVETMSEMEIICFLNIRDLRIFQPWLLKNSTWTLTVSFFECFFLNVLFSPSIIFPSKKWYLNSDGIIFSDFPSGIILPVPRE